MLPALPTVKTFSIFPLSLSLPLHVSCSRSCFVSALLRIFSCKVATRSQTDTSEDDPFTMSTPRRSGRLQKREEGKVKREGRLRTRREHQLSKGGSNGGSDSSGSDSEEERLMITPTQTSAKKRVNDFVKVSVSN